MIAFRRSVHVFFALALLVPSVTLACNATSAPTKRHAVRPKIRILRPEIPQHQSGSSARLPDHDPDPLADMILD